MLHPEILPDAGRQAEPVQKLRFVFLAPFQLRAIAGKRSAKPLL
jgi:hypothetical protein